jgi:uncharacterized membrane protein
MKLNPIKDMKLTDMVNPYRLFVSREENIKDRRQAIKSFKAKANAKRKPAEKFADLLTSKFGSMTFLILNLIWFASWIVINKGMTSIKPFDPYPFSFLTMVVSLEAIFLAIIVLISQNRESKVAEVREEIDLQLNTVTEEELTKLISLVVQIAEKQGIKVDDDPELAKMLIPTNTAKLERDIEKELSDN